MFENIKPGLYAESGTGMNFFHWVRNMWKQRVWMRTTDRPLTMKSQMGATIIIRCIYKSGTTSPARLPSHTSHCITAPCQGCRLVLALLIHCTTQSRWMANRNNPQFSLWSFMLQVPGLWDSFCLACSHSPHWTHTHAYAWEHREEWSIQGVEKGGTICDVCKLETFRLIQELDWVCKRDKVLGRHVPKLLKENTMFTLVFPTQNTSTLEDIFPWEIYESPNSSSIQARWID